MSNQNVSARALNTLTLVSVFALTSCASSGTQKDPVYIGPTNPSAEDGKTIENMLAAKFPGVTVTRGEDGGLHIGIRGASNSFYGSSEPLYIVDDVEIDVGPKGILNINPYDIERIQVLKNPEDVGIYGVRGANGVIKIILKKPGKN